MFKVTKATCKMVNGDKLVLKPNKVVESTDDYREELHSQYECKSIILVYEEVTNEPAPEGSTEEA